MLIPYVHESVEPSVNCFSAGTVTLCKTRAGLHFFSQTLKHLHSLKQAQESTVMLHDFVLHFFFPILFNVSIYELQIDNVTE